MIRFFMDVNRFELQKKKIFIYLTMNPFTDEQAKQHKRKGMIISYIHTYIYIYISLESYMKATYQQPGSNPQTAKH